MQGKARKGTGARTSKTPAGGGEVAPASLRLGEHDVRLHPDEARLARVPARQGSSRAGTCLFARRAGITQEVIDKAAESDSD